MDTGTSRHMYTTQRLKHIQMIVINLNSKLLMSEFDNYSRTVKNIHFISHVQYAQKFVLNHF